MNRRRPQQKVVLEQLSSSPEWRTAQELRPDASRFTNAAGTLLNKMHHAGLVKRKWRDDGSPRPSYEYQLTRKGRNAAEEEDDAR